MDILKSFNLIKKTILLNILIIISLSNLIYIYTTKTKIFIKINVYLKTFIKNTIIKKIRNIFLLFNITLFFNILILNLTDLLPCELVKKIIRKNINLVPTSDINTTFNFSILSILIIIYLTIYEIGLFKFINNFITKPINLYLLYWFNFLIEFISFIMKPISLSLRLFGNIFSSDIIFKLISKMNFFSNILFNLSWGIFHYLVLPLQSFIFITLVIIYLSQNIQH